MHYFSFFVFVALSLARAQASGFDHEMSASLKTFLSANPSCKKALDDVISQLPTGTALRLKYFSSANDFVARASHGYDASGIIVSLRTDQQPCDEFIGLYFEVANSHSRKLFEALMDEAKSASITRDQFPIELLRLEFAAVKKTRDVIKSLAISPGEQRSSYFYARFADCPNDFDDYLAYRQRVSPKRDPNSDYKRLYDQLAGGKQLP